MPEQSAVPMIVLTRHQDNVEAINSTLRNAGLAVRCNWIRELNDLGEALTQINAHMLVAFVGQDPADTTKVMAVCKQFGAEVPVLIAREQVDEDVIAAAMQQGARDAVTLANPQRLQLVVARELEAHNRAQALNRTIGSAREYREQLKSFMAGSADAIAHVQEGIVVDANPAWLELYGLPDADSILGTPLMDAFDAEAHAAIKGALVACLQGKWSNHSLRANALLADGTSVPLDIELSPVEFEGDPAVRLCVAAEEARRRDHQRAADGCAGARRRDRSAAAALLRPTTAAGTVATDQGRHPPARRDPARQARYAGRRRRPARDRRDHRPVRRPDCRDAPGERSVRPLRRRHVHAADGARHATRRRDLGEAI